jgi:hypothetical protein
MKIFMKHKYSDEELVRKGLSPNDSVKKTLRYNISVVAAKTFEVGSIVEAVDKTVSPYGRIPRQITAGKKYKVNKVIDCVIEIENDSHNYVRYYANRFKKVEK